MTMQAFSTNCCRNREGAIYASVALALV